MSVVLVTSDDGQHRVRIDNDAAPENEPLYVIRCSDPDCPNYKGDPMFVRTMADAVEAAGVHVERPS